MISLYAPFNVNTHKTARYCQYFEKVHVFVCWLPLHPYLHCVKSLWSEPIPHTAVSLDWQAHTRDRSSFQRLTMNVDGNVWASLKKLARTCPMSPSIPKSMPRSSSTSHTFLTTSLWGGWGQFLAACEFHQWLMMLINQQPGTSLSQHNSKYNCQPILISS